MKIGVRAHDYGKMEIEQLAEKLHNCSYECAQLALPKAFVGIDSYSDITLKHLERIRESFEKYQIEIPVFGCYMDLGNPNNEVRQHAINTLKMCLAYSKEVGANVVGTETSYAWLNDEQKKIWYPFMIEAIKEVIEEAVRLDVKLAIEPVYIHPLDSIEVVMDVFEKINDEKHLRMIFDASNVLKISDVEHQEVYWTEWLRATGKYIEAMHIKDFYFDENGQSIPTALGKGVIQYEVISKWLHANKPDMYLLREEMKPTNAEADISFMKKL